jgi:hypothetical protein
MTTIFTIKDTDGYAHDVIGDCLADAWARLCEPYEGDDEAPKFLKTGVRQRSVPDADDWVDKYKPVRNHLVDDAPMDGAMFETFPPESDYVWEQHQKDPRRVWTEVDCDGVLYIIPGWHFVNRFGYYITEIPWEDGEQGNLEFVVG